MAAKRSGKNPRLSQKRKSRKKIARQSAAAAVRESIRKKCPEHAEASPSTTRTSLNNLPSNKITGRRVVDITCLLEGIRNICKHEPFDCTFADMQFVSESRWGLESTLHFECKMCNMKADINTEDPQKREVYANVNTVLVSGMFAIGGGYSQASEICAALDMPMMSKNTWSKYQEKVVNAYEKAANLEMLQAGKEEAELAREAGDVDSDGIPMITVVADCSWSKRSYGNNYNALSGTAAIVGYRTKKVLHIEVRNKYCSICDRRRSQADDIQDHKCYKNWSAPSTAMEADGILAGFKKSIEIHGVKYARLIGDGDSSVHKKLTESLPYGPDMIVEKIECRNHILRNYCNKLRDVSLKTSVGTVAQRKLLRGTILRLRSAVTKAIQFRKLEKIPQHVKSEELKTDILNGPYHIFGDHRNCKSYFCTGPKEGEINMVLELSESGIFSEILAAVSRVAFHANSLIEDVDNNCVELYNAYVAKAVGGKRINYSLRQSYQGRCQGAVVAHNKKGQLHEAVHKAVTDRSPGFFTKQYGQKRKRAIESKLKPNCKKVRRSLLTADADVHYGPNAALPLPDMAEQDLLDAKNNYLSTLKSECSLEHLSRIETETRGQISSRQWRDERRKRITASLFGKICKMRATTSCASVVECIRYPTFSGNVNTQWGIENEHTARTEFMTETGLSVTKCGLFIDESYPFLAATPDGLIENDAVLEIKCPASAKEINPQDDNAVKKLTYLRRENNCTKLREDSIYFYQIQGQMNITKRDKCYFVVWTPKGMLIDVIQKNDEFWKNIMLPKLEKFYWECLLPEIVDSRRARQLSIRDPDFILQAQQEAVKRKQEKTKKKN